VIPPNSKSAFNIIFARAQTILRQNFGMELYELRARGKGAGAVGPDGVETQTQAQTQPQKQKKKQARPSRLDAIEEEEEEEDEEEAEEEQQAVTVVKREVPSIGLIRADSQNLDRRLILSDQSYLPK
jgi:ribosomal protein L12E/L44/L45/RPP1/RPP2